MITSWGMNPGQLEEMNYKQLVEEAKRIRSEISIENYIEAYNNLEEKANILMSYMFNLPLLHGENIEFKYNGKRFKRERMLVLLDEAEQSKNIIYPATFSVDSLAESYPTLQIYLPLIYRKFAKKAKHVEGSSNSLIQQKSNIQSFSPPLFPELNFTFVQLTILIDILKDINLESDLIENNEENLIKEKFKKGKEPEEGNYKIQEIIEKYCKKYLPEKLLESPIVIQTFNKVNTVIEYYNIMLEAFEQYVPISSTIDQNYKYNAIKNRLEDLSLIISAKNFANLLKSWSIEPLNLEKEDSIEQVIDSAMKIVSNDFCEKISVLKYIKAYDELEAKAKYWMEILIYLNKLKGENVVFNYNNSEHIRKRVLLTLQEAENENIIYPAMFRHDIFDEFMSNISHSDLLYRYVDIKDILTINDCEEIFVNDFSTFYELYAKLNDKIQRKLEKEIMNPFLIQQNNQEINGSIKRKYIEEDSKFIEGRLETPLKIHNELIEQKENLDTVLICPSTLRGEFAPIYSLDYEMVTDISKSRLIEVGETLVRAGAYVAGFCTQ
uniref:Helicase ATP-binding domain-containing protein n=1 Tax=Meloidogyne hapla TaxID=6305 RepID=A0A1I8BN39_MELHA